MRISNIFERSMRHYLGTCSMAFRIGRLMTRRCGAATTRAKRGFGALRALAACAAGEEGMRPHDPAAHTTA